VGYAQDKQVTRTFSGVKKIRISTSSGSCYVKKGAGNDIQVKLEHTYSGGYTPTMEQEGTTLVVKEEFDNGSHSGSSIWTLTVPDGIEFIFNTGSGSFEAQNILLGGKFNLGSGNVELSAVKGDLRVNTGSGDITLQNVTGEVDGNTGSGDIEVVKSEGEFGINAGSGNIRLTDVKGRLTANVGSGNIKAGQIVLTGKGSFNSGSGDVTVTLATSLDYNISVNSGSGDAKLDFNGNKIDGTVIMTANKRNGKIVAPFKFDKTEELDDDGNNIRIRKTTKLGSKDIEIKISTGSGTAEISK
jgi:hypothetical protein